ncbi:hypothetical protein DL764_007563 [Monosporascus ibericus]|uniref:U6 snRNA phosphodiesterase n=1 Tax=Monosporascus ibericus TaxID=155417 RepID=A0A4V1X9I7_9PEZI|nr:hypothetical protein DL764_007563 [Monosporascus ibericus]
MALVDYSSSDSDLDSDPDYNSTVDPPSLTKSKGETRDEATTSVKRQKVSHTKIPDNVSSSLPPLPSAFHDLYASTVRVSTNDDPNLHQGRRRVNPHKAGNWPTHLYIEYEIRSSSTPSTEILSFLNSDLGAPQPLHISLSRPIVLNTSQKDGFLERLITSVKKSGIQPFNLAPWALSWHRTAESERSFLVLRVANKVGDTTAHEDAKTGPSNPELANLLGRCNGLVTEYGQPPLYAPKALDGSNMAPHDAFHISVAWSLAEVDADLQERTEEVFSKPEFRDGVGAICVHVDGIKAKIGNMVTHVALPMRGKIRSCLPQEDSP